MLRIGEALSGNCQGLSRREILQVGGLGALGLSLADLWRARAVQGSPAASAAGRAGEKSCIFIFLSGGPSHLETFDPKPAAPINVRGPYGTIATRVPGVRISELLPQTAEQLDQCTILRSMTNKAGDHS